VGKSHVAVGENTDQSPRPLPLVLQTGNTGDVVALHQGQRIIERRLGRDRDGFTTMPDSNFFTRRTWLP